jgi:hypothetical protein
MKLTKKFWIWVSQVAALVILLLRVDLIIGLFKIVPNFDLSQFYPEIALLTAIVILWLLWLVWRGYVGFYQKMDFLIDENDRRW